MWFVNAELTGSSLETFKEKKDWSCFKPNDKKVHLMYDNKDRVLLSDIIRAIPLLDK